MIANPLEIPITDNHIHVDHINGIGPVKVAKQFYNVGGRVMIIPNKPSWSMGETFEFEKAMDLVISYCHEITQNTKVKAFPVVGVHPAEFSKLIESGKSLEDSYKRVKKALDYGKKLVEEKKAVGIGEIGRPHYEVNGEEMNYQNKILKYGLRLAKELDCPVQLHTESAEEEQFKEFASFADEINFNKKKLIKHYSGPYILEEENFGLTPSVMSGKDNIKKAIAKGDNFLMETDYLDELSRPGAVLGLKTVPKRTLDFLNKGIFTEEDAFKIHKDNIESIYGINTEID
ncbi:TatD family hydrolase [Methanobrevibacter sp. TMH8]|uniref:TatD family hydrolase n=1 Tax=Methanobrevibacter sp. TMH8 TaxID=2848611 RepID=UPI001CCD14D4|nr:TatD family hydrolase [Methanobrevibacter sp. TMH8]MBZ9570239.1 TatD family hydrolase [Methanobrevibacter sp. TMH8]